MADEIEKKTDPSTNASGTASEDKHPCEGCVHFYGAYKHNRCCNYLFDTGKRRPCPPGEDCTVKRIITCKEDLRLRKATQFY